MFRKAALSFAAMVLAFALLPFTAGAQEPQDGVQYVRLKNPQAVESGKKIEVIEFFSYGCPHCAHLEPFLGPWVKKLPSDVQFRRVPALFQQSWPNLAKGYYTLEALGVEEKLSQSMFDGIHNEHLALHQDQAFFDWAAKKGLDRAKTADIYGSFAINSKLMRAKSLAGAYHLEGVPTLIVDGKFMTDLTRAGGPLELTQLLDKLIAKARQERPKS
jgi:thiol:disulfide interchange protein DsbA